MIKYLKEYRFFIFLSFFILVPILALDTASRQPRDYSRPDRIISSITYPIQWAIASTLDFLAKSAERYLLLIHVQRNNQELVAQNQILLGNIVSLKEAQEENIRLRNLLGFKEEHNLKTISARLIAKDISTEFRAIRINRGDSHGVKKDMAVVTADGVVGRVFRVAKDWSDVVTILDPLSAIDAFVKRTRVRGILEGLTDQVCQLKFALRTDDVQVDDLVISSGLGGIFPKGLAVGVVSSTTKSAYGITQKIEVRPSVDFAKLEEVLVVTELDTGPIHTSDRGRFEYPEELKL